MATLNLRPVSNALLIVDADANDNNAPRGAVEFRLPVR